jgi:uncharacterized protein involved in exopolysaccharide biosynthesis
MSFGAGMASGIGVGIAVGISSGQQAERKAARERLLASTERYTITIHDGATEVSLERWLEEVTTPEAPAKNQKVVLVILLVLGMAVAGFVAAFALMR